jgi:zinc finger BED domain-containing protein 1 (E3 SUMO-protein ligase ZBED1)
MGYLKVVVVSDNAANIQAAISKLPHLCTPLSCFDHTLQLAINDAVKKCVQVQETITKAKAITCHFKHSTNNTKRLLELEKQLGLPQLKLKQECPTRWNSRYDMLERLVTVKGAVSAIVASVKTAPCLSAAEWEIADEYVKVLKPFKVATATMGAANYPTISMIIPELNSLKHSLSNETCQFDCLPTLKEDLLANIDSRWPGYETKPVYAASTILDPRYKDCGFNEASAAAYSRYVVLREMIAEMKKKAAATPMLCDSADIQTGMAYTSVFHHVVPIL